MQENKQRGGSRPGSGRKKGAIKKLVSFRIEDELLKKLEEVGNKNKFVNAAIREKLERLETVIKEVEELK